MYWTQERKLLYLLRLPWTLVPERTPEGDRLLRVRELASVVGAGATDADLEEDLWEAMREALRAYLHFGDPIPLPAGQSLPWLEGESVQRDRDKSQTAGFPAHVVRQEFAPA